MSSVIISSLSSPTSDALTFSSLSLSGYRVVTLVVWGVDVGTDDADVRLEVSQSSAWLTGASDYSYVCVSRSTGGTDVTETDGAEAHVRLNDTAANWGVGNASGEVFSVRIELVNHEASEPRYFTFNGAHIGPTGNSVMTNGQAVINNSTDIDGLRIVLSTGTMNAGKAALIGTA